MRHEMNKYIPDRKFIAGGISGILAFALVTFLGLDAELASTLTGAAMALVFYLVPPSVKDIVKRVDQNIIDLATKSE